MEAYPFIGDVRGKGLLLAFELVADRETMAPLPKEANAYLRLVEHAYERGLIIYSRRTRGGLEGDHFLVCPPMITTGGAGGRDHRHARATASIALADELGLPRAA